MTAASVGAAPASAGACAAQPGDPSGQVGVVLGQFEALVALGLMTLLEGEPRVTLAASGLDGVGVRAMSARSGALVAVLGEPTCYEQALQTLAALGGVIVLARGATVPMGRLLVGVGVSCLDFGVSERDLLDAIRLTARGGCVLLAADGQRVTRRDRRESLLTEREVSVLKLLSRGASYAEIAAHLSISVETVRKHAGSVYRKLGARGKSQLLGLPVDWLGDQSSYRPSWTSGYAPSQPLSLA